MLIKNRALTSEILTRKQSDGDKINQQYSCLIFGGQYL